MKREEGKKSCASPIEEADTSTLDPVTSGPLEDVRSVAHERRASTNNGPPQNGTAAKSSWLSQFNNRPVGVPPPSAEPPPPPESQPGDTGSTEIATTTKGAVASGEPNAMHPVTSVANKRHGQPEQRHDLKLQQDDFLLVGRFQKRGSSIREENATASNGGQRLRANSSRKETATASNEGQQVSSSAQQVEQKQNSDTSEPFNILSVVKERASMINPPENGTTMPSLLSELNSPVQDMPTQSPEPPSESQPGAYTAAPGTTVDRVENLNFSLVGVPVEATTPASEDIATGVGNGTNTTSTMRPPTPTLPDNENSSNSFDNELLEAIPVESEQFASTMMEAQPIDQDNLDKNDAKYARRKIFGFGSLVIACVLLAVSLAIHLTNKKESSSVVDAETITPTGSPTDSPTRPLPPMENLEILYAELPEKTIETLYDNTSPQYRAWEWLLNHPNITTFPEWRKKQVFAMVTFYYSFEGPLWPRSRWLNASSSECDWVLHDDEVKFLADESTKVLGRNAYGAQDYQPCNDNGELQTLMLPRLFLTSSMKPSMPQEIELLTSLKMMGVIFSQITAKLFDLLIPELIELPHLVYLNFHSSGISGTIPKEIGLMTGLRHLLLGENELTGTFPVELANMTSLELCQFFASPGLTGRLPSEIGLMTKLTHLGLAHCSLTGHIPTQVGILSQIKEINFWDNSLTGHIPTELGLLTSMTILDIDHNRLGESIPSELGLMASMEQLWLKDNGLEGSLPSQLGLMTNARILFLGNALNGEDLYNSFSGHFPTELWMLSHLEWLWLANLPNLHGTFPTSIPMPNNISLLRLEGSPHLTGTVPGEICYLQDELPTSEVADGPSLKGQALEFDCSDSLCGCNCECT